MDPQTSASSSKGDKKKKRKEMEEKRRQRNVDIKFLKEESKKTNQLLEETLKKLDEEERELLKIKEANESSDGKVTKNDIQMNVDAWIEATGVSGVIHDHKWDSRNRNVEAIQEFIEEKTGPIYNLRPRGSNIRRKQFQSHEK